MPAVADPFHVTRSLLCGHSARSAWMGATPDFLLDRYAHRQEFWFSFAGFPPHACIGGPLRSIVNVAWSPFLLDPFLLRCLIPPQPPPYPVSPAAATLPDSIPQPGNLRWMPYGRSCLHSHPPTATAPPRPLFPSPPIGASDSSSALKPGAHYVGDAMSPSSSSI